MILQVDAEPGDMRKIAAHRLVSQLPATSNHPSPQENLQEHLCACSVFLSSFVTPSASSQHRRSDISNMLSAPHLSFLALLMTRLFVVSQAIGSAAPNDSLSVSNYEYWHCFSSNAEAAYLAGLNDCQKLLLTKQLPKRAILGEYQLFQSSWRRTLGVLWGGH